MSGMLRSFGDSVTRAKWKMRVRIQSGFHELPLAYVRGLKNLKEESKKDVAS
jgi:hypothetical protein